MLEEVEPGWRKHFAKFLCVSRTSFYNQPKRQQDLDSQAVATLRATNTEFPFYGVRRLALELNWSQNKTRRIRTKAGIVIPIASKKRRRGKGLPPEITAPANALKTYADFKNPDKPQDSQTYAKMAESGAWVQDFTHLYFDRQEHYLAVVLDLKTRQVVGWRLGLRHSSELTHSALLDALSKHPIPTILHSDQGSEYLSHKHQLLCDKLEITLSCSKRASPWQNGFMERFFCTFKLEMGNLNKHQDLPQLHEAIALYIHHYNTKRIHTALRMSPAVYAARLKQQNKKPKFNKPNLVPFVSDKVFGRVGA